MPGLEQGVDRRKALGVGQAAEQAGVHGAGLLGRDAGRLCRLHEIGFEHGFVPQEAVHEEQHAGLLGLGQPRRAHALQPALEPQHLVRHQRRAADRDAHEPAMPAQHGEVGAGPTRQPGAPRLIRFGVGRRGGEGRVDHVGEQLVLRRHVTVEGHGRRTQLARHAAHRYRGETVRDGDAKPGLDNRRQPQARTASPRPRLPSAPRRRDAARDVLAIV